MRQRDRSALMAAAVAAVMSGACESGHAAVPVAKTVRVGSGFASPMFVTSPPGDSRIFVAERGGTIRILDNPGAGGTASSTAVLDISSIVESATGERGLLGLTFDPNFATNRRFYVDYIDKTSLNTVVSRYTLPAGSNVADTSSRLDIITIPQPATRNNHKAGWIGFRPGEAGANLYVALGDGGSANDPDNNGQNTNVLLGKMLRLDVSNSSTATRYAIPAGNPFAGPTAGADEIWAYGLRNPFRDSFDRGDGAANHRGDFYIGDVGQSLREEIDYEAGPGIPGRNYGWRAREGTQDNPNVSDPAPPNATDPIYDYATAPSSAVIGGYVYRGSAYPELQGTYFFGDEVRQKVWSFKYDGTTLTDFTDRTAAGGVAVVSMSGFGEDAGGELYMSDLLGGQIFRFFTPGRFNWNVDAAANWSPVTSWIEGVTANGVDAFVTFGSKITVARTVTLDAAETAGTLNFDNAVSYTIAGSANLTLDVSAGSAAVNVLSGSHTISAPLVLNDATTFTVTPAASVLTVSNLTAAGQNVTKAGAGTLAVNRVRASALSVQGGVVRMIDNGGDAGASVVNSLTIAGATNAWTARLDLRNNDMIVHSTAAARAAKVAEITNQLKQGSNFASNNAALFWTGNGIITSLGGNGASSYTAIGVIYNDYAGIGQPSAPIFTSFDGQSVGVNDVLMKYTYFGDADLSGTITSNDYFQIDVGFLAGKSGWINGDFDYNGVINSNDYLLIDNAFLHQGAALAPAPLPAVAVPEPGAIAIASGALALVARRTRRVFSQA